MEVNGWVITSGPIRQGGRVYVKALCPLCQDESLRRKDCLRAGACCIKCYNKARGKGGNRTARARVVRNYKKICAEGRGHEFLLDDDELEILFQSDCHYCGAMPSNKMIYKRSPTNTEVYIYNGIDRVDTSKGYVTENVVAACSICNRAKGNLSQDEFMAWIGRIK